MRPAQSVALWEHHFSLTVAWKILNNGCIWLNLFRSLSYVCMCENWAQSLREGGRDFTRCLISNEKSKCINARDWWDLYGFVYGEIITKNTEKGKHNLKSYPESLKYNQAVEYPLRTQENGKLNAWEEKNFEFKERTALQTLAWSFRVVPHQFVLLRRGESEFQICQSVELKEKTSATFLKFRRAPPESKT